MGTRTPAPVPAELAPPRPADGASRRTRTAALDQQDADQRTRASEARTSEAGTSEARTSAKPAPTDPASQRVPSNPRSSSGSSRSQDFFAVFVSESFTHV
jgi:hypothetical protein